MCLGFPGRVEKIDELTADVDIAGTKRNVSRIFIAEELNIGDWVMVHAGFAMSKMDEKEAKETLEFLLSVAADEEAREDEYYKNLENKKNQDVEGKHAHNHDDGHQCGCHKESSSDEDKHGEHKHGEHKHGEHKHGEHKHGEHKHGEHKHGEKKGCCGGGGCGSK